MRTLIIAGLIFLTGCSAKMISANEGQEISATVGSPFLTWQTGTFMGAQSTAIKRELVYLGSEGSVVEIGYREYGYTKPGMVGGSWYARPAFNNGLRYDTAKGQEIAFQDARFKVNGFDSSNIRVTMIKAPALE